MEKYISAYQLAEQIERMRSTQRDDVLAAIANMKTAEVLSFDAAAQAMASAYNAGFEQGRKLEQEQRGVTAQEDFIMRRFTRRV